MDYSLCHKTRTHIIPSREWDLADGLEYRAFPRGLIATNDKLWKIDVMVDLIRPNLVDGVKESPFSFALENVVGRARQSWLLPDTVDRGTWPLRGTHLKNI